MRQTHKTQLHLTELFLFVKIVLAEAVRRFFDSRGLFLYFILIRSDSYYRRYTNILTMYCIFVMNEQMNKKSYRATFVKIVSA